MSTIWSLITFTIFIYNISGICHAAVYSDKWAVQVEGGEELAKQLANEYDFTYLGKVRCHLQNVFES